MTSEPVSDPNVTEIDGVATVWNDVPGPLRAGLVIRVGTADETLVTSGISHLLEHLALFGLGRPGDHSNGFVNQTIMMYQCVGDQAEVVTFLDGVTRQLREPPVHRLEAEREVLRAEESARPGAVDDWLLRWRYGAAGYGLSGQGELGRPYLDPAAIQAWSAGYATRGNAVLWLSGPPPAGLKLNLPDGVRRLPPDPRPSILPELPAWFAGPSQRVALHSVLQRSTTNRALTSVLRSRLVDELRTRQAVAYSPQVDYQPLTADHARLLAISDLVADKQSDAVRSFIGILHNLAADGAVSEQDLTEWRAGLTRELANSSQLSLGRVTACALQEAFGGPPAPREQLEAEIAAVTPADVTAAAGLVLAGALAQIPDGVRMIRQPWVPAAGSTEEPVTGVQYQNLERPDGQVLVFSEQGLTLQGKGSAHVTVRQESAAAVQSWPDGRRTIVGLDGNRITVEPTLWAGGPELVSRLDRLYPPALRLQMPARRADQIPAPKPRPKPAAVPVPAKGLATRALVQQVLSWVVLGIAVLLVVVLITRPSLAESGPQLVFLTLIATSCGIRVYRGYAARRRRRN